VSEESCRIASEGLHLPFCREALSTAISSLIRFSDLSTARKILRELETSDEMPVNSFLNCFPSLALEAVISRTLFSKHGTRMLSRKSITDIIDGLRLAEEDCRDELHTVKAMPAPMLRLAVDGYSTHLKRRVDQVDSGSRAKRHDLKYVSLFVAVGSYSCISRKA
jgi:hypothetical protein